MSIGEASSTRRRSEEDALEAAAAVASGPFAARAADYDESRSFPLENYADLHEAGLLVLTVPRRYGGVEASWAAYLGVLRTIGRACGSTALTLNMHSTVARYISLLGNEEQCSTVFGSLVERGAALASITSEPGATMRGQLVLKTTATPQAGGYVVNGFKHFCSLAHGAEYYFVWAMLEGAESVADGLVNLVVPAGSSGIEIIDVWDTMSMRATDSQSMRLEDVFVPSEWMIGSPGEVIARGLVDQFSPGYAAVHLGIAEGAYAFARDYVMTTVFEPDPTPISHHPPIQAQIAEIAVRLTTARLMVDEAARAAESLPPAQREPLLAQVKWFVTETARDVAVRSLDVVGGRGLARSKPLERMLRDVMAGPIQPPSADTCRYLVATNELGLPSSRLGQER